ncbi:hypothetical protein [Frankia sp. CiP3]|uniref:hypothetical protein n=1 Tax=Frankia sp. CiP3 TaxID=2880971 RepID=UPI001EF50C52|nr:hypothetical protein [Frankia sp. CiP3]
MSCRALNAAIESGHLVDVPVDSIAADTLGARHASAMALEWAGGAAVHSVLVRDNAALTGYQLTLDSTEAPWRKNH